MCYAIPGKIIEIKDNKAIVDYGEERIEARLINKDIKVGDYVFVQNKLIIQSVPEKDALESIKLWNALKNEN